MIDNSQFKPEEYGVAQDFLNEIIALKNQNVDKYIPIHIQQHSKLLADLIIANAKPRADVYIFTEHFPHIFFAQAIEKTKGKVKLLIEQGDINPDSFKKKQQPTNQKTPRKTRRQLPLLLHFRQRLHLRHRHRKRLRCRQFQQPQRRQNSQRKLHQHVG